MADVPERVRPFWDAFGASITYDASPLFYEAFHFADDERMANDLVALVLSGHKHATAALLWMYELTNKPLPEIGALSVATDWHGTPLCVIQTTHVEIVPFESVTDRFAAAEGEGDRTLRFWREAHWRYFSKECERMGREPSPQMPIICEQFRVVYRRGEA